MSKLSMPEKAAQITEFMLNDPQFGYSQISRWGINKYTTCTLSDNSKVTLKVGDRDCSSAMIEAWKKAGLKLKGATYTGNMRQAFLNTGMFKWHPGTSYSAKRGDIYLNEKYHTAMCLHPYGSKEGDILGEFSISENGTIDGKEGDQLNNKGSRAESHERAYYDYPWDGILEYVGKPKPKPKPKPTTKKPDIKYAFKLRGGAWLSYVKNYGVGANGFAGLPYHAHNSFKATTTRGSIKYRVANERGQWTRFHKDGEPVTIKGKICEIEIQHSDYDTELRFQTTERVPWSSWRKNGKGGIKGEAIDRLQVRLTNRK